MQLSPDQKSVEAQLTTWVLGENQRGRSVDLAALEEKAGLVASIFSPDLTEHEIAQVVVVVTTKGDVKQAADVGVVGADFEEWIQARKAEVEESRWEAYKGLLISRGFAPAVIDALGRQTDAVVELMGDPHRTGPWARRGLLMGEVQSGKTATYLGVLNKAIDHGYRVIVILGGHTNDLRSQTQRRVDTDLTGTNSTFLEDNISVAGEQIRIGIGLVNPTLTANSMTTVRRDFSAESKLAGMVWVSSGMPTVFVVKKNVKMLENVRKYIAAQAGPDGLDLPLVVVDDEADWGSPNTNDPDTDPTRVNKAVRSLLDVSSRNTYVGITATPFANVLIDHTIEDDLFPSDYIRALGAPSNYSGVDTYFGAGSSAIRTDVDDCLAVLPLKHKKDHQLASLPSSLEDALIAFFLGTAIRRIRDGATVPASMMVNVSRFNLVQIVVSRLVKDFVSEVAGVIATEFERIGGTRRSQLAERIERSMAQLYPLDSNWSEIERELIDVAREMRVEVVNNQTAAERAKTRRLMSHEQRVAEDLKPVILIGGDVLSRGLTLEGLQVSYFVRQPGSADTLLQMGRWFGYRPGYEDLVRIWIPRKVVEIFGNVAAMNRDLREDLMEMQANELTPRQFGLKIRLIPEIAIVAANKRRAAEVAEVRVSLHGQIRQSVDLSSDVGVRNANAEAVDRLARRLEVSGIRFKPSGHEYGWHGVPLEAVTEFIASFQGHSIDPFFSRSGRDGRPQIAKFLPEARNSDGWDVVFVSGGGRSVMIPHIGDASRASVRNELRYIASDSQLHFQNRQIASPSDVRGALEESEVVRIKASAPEGAKLNEGEYLRHYIERPILMLYAVTREDKGDGLVIDESDPLWAVRVAFPRLTPEEEQDYIAAGGGVKILVNTVWQEQFFGTDQESDDYNEELDG
ncbi:Z1 domain-containing protein [Schumannella soli]|uniref:Putative endonuclease Z1 domain-containing protein n=1 Tax=Schumannella soli TaxID=2590779 RepID=A0A506Y1G4_9MICO|nr:Z1 domain-containing protein [Schumannella soli]TPW75733.1 hypothetical protein FJ657_07620 [Schumannella soli]